MANNPMQYAQALSLPLTRQALQIAQQFAQQQPSPEKSAQVYLNTLAVWLANEYLQLMGVETNLTGSDSWNPVVRMWADVADLLLANGERLECRPVSANNGDRAERCLIPPEVWEERRGGMASRARGEAKHENKQGYSPTAAAGELSLAELQPLAALLEAVAGQVSTATQPVAHLSQWLQGQVDAGWQRADAVLGNVTASSAASNVPQNLNRWFEDLGDLLEAGWQSVEAVFGPPSPPAVQFRSPAQPAIAPPSPLDSSILPQGEVQRAKLLDFGVQLGDSAIALVIVLSRQPDGRLNVQVQVHPFGEYLPADLELALVSETDETLQAVTSRGQDLWMQLPAFKVRPESYFSLRVRLGEVSFSETFLT